ncbi:MAG: hypothetical protein ACYTFA_02985 [Planctomycetota bacterium]|jgi:hypothetical protein
MSDLGSIERAMRLQQMINEYLRKRRPHLCTAQSSALKGPSIVAQGNALGAERAKQNQAL